MVREKDAPLGNWEETVVVSRQGTKAWCLPLTAHPVPALVAPPSPALDLENKEKQPGLWSQAVGEEVSLWIDM